MAGTQKTHGEGINEYVSFALEQEIWGLLHNLEHEI